MNFLSADAQYMGLAHAASVAEHGGRHLLEAKYLAYVAAVDTTLMVTGALSLLGSLSVCVTCLLFWKTMVSNKIYMQMILMISLSDFITSITVMWGMPTDASLCSWQSGLGRFFFRRYGCMCLCVPLSASHCIIIIHTNKRPPPLYSTWFWATFMILTLWTYISAGKSFMTFRNMNMLCWSLNLLLCFLPFSTHTYYGEDDDRLGRSLCSFRAGNEESEVRSDDVKLWIIITSYTPCSLAVATMFVLLFVTARKVNTFATIAGKRIRKLVRNTSLYPLITVLLWLPNMICFLVAEWGYPHRPSDEVYWNNIFLPTRLTYCWATLGGFFVSVAFFVNSKEARNRWSALLWRRENFVEDKKNRTSDSSSLESQGGSSKSDRHTRHTSYESDSYNSDDYSDFEDEEDFDFKEDSVYERESITMMNTRSLSGLSDMGGGQRSPHGEERIRPGSVNNPVYHDEEDGGGGDDHSVKGIEMNKPSI